MAKSKLKQEDLVLNIIVNGNKAQSDIGKVSRALRDAKQAASATEDEMKHLERQGLTNTKRYRELTAELDRHKKEIIQNKDQLNKLNQSLKLEEQSISTLERSLRNLIKLRKQSIPDSDQYKAYTREIEVVTNRLNQLRMEGQRTGNVLQRMGNGIRNFLSSQLGAIASITALITGVRKATDEYTRWDDKIADVMKTTNGAKEEVVALNDELEKLDTRTSQEDLLGLARIGGKLGITDMDELRGFVEATNQVVVALNEDLGGDVESTVQAVGKLVDIFNIDQVYGYEQGLLKVGSAINVLGMSSTANEGYMVDFARRMAGIAPLANVTVQQILGLGATLDQFGQTSEVSSTALNKLFVQMASDAKTYSKYAGMELKDFQELLEKDFMSAFIRVLEGVRGSSQGIANLASTLGDLGIDATRITGVLGTLANNTGTLRQQIDLANVSFEEGTSLTEEYNIKNETAAAQLEKARKEVTKFWRELGKKLWPVIIAGNNLLTTFLRIIISMIDFVGKYIKVIGPLIAAIVAYNAVLVINNLLTTQSIALTKLRIFWDKAWAASIALVTAGYALLTGNIAGARAAMIAFNTVVGLNPIAALVGVLAAASAALYLFNRRVLEGDQLQRRIKKATDEATASTLAQRTEIERNQKVLRDSTKTQEEKLTAIKNLRDIMPSVLQNYTNEEILAGKATKAVGDHTKAILLRAQARAYESEIESAEREKIQLEGQLSSDGKTSGFDRLPILERVGYAARAALKGMTAYTLWLDEVEEKHKAASARQQEFLKLTNQINAEIDKLESSQIVPDYVPPGGGGGDEKATRAANKARLAELEDSKKAYQSQLEAEGLFRKDRREMTAEELEKMLAIEQSYQSKVDEINKKYQHSTSETTKIAESELLKRELAERKYRDKLLDPRDPKYVQEQEAHEERLKLAGLFGKQREQLTVEQLKALERLEAIHAANIGKIDAAAMKKGVEDRQKSYQDELTDLRIRNNEELAQVRTLEQAKQKLSSTLSQDALRQVKTLNQAKRLLQSQYQQEEANLTRQHLEELRSLMQSVLDNGEWEGIDLADKILSPEEKKVLEENLRKVREELAKLRNPDQTDIAEDKANKVDVLGMSMTDWETLFANLEAGKLGVQDVANALLAMNQIWAQYNAFVAAGENRQLQEYEYANNRKKESLEKRLDSGQISQEAYNKQIEKMDKDLAKKRARMEYDQAKRERNIAISNAIANTAVAVTKVLAQGGIAGIVLAAVVGALGALQLATIIKQPLPSLSGREDGGYLVRRSDDGQVFDATYDPDKRGYVNRPTVITGEDGSEFVASKQAVDNPSVKPILDVIDTAQRNGTISTLQLEKVLPRSREIRASIPGRQKGGSVSDSAPVSSATSSTDMEEMRDLVRKNTEVMNGLTQEIRKGIKAEVALLGKNGFYEKDAEYKSIQSSANL